MISLPEEKVLYSEIQKKIFYIIPEKWESIHLYASIIDVPNKKPIGEMYFYYLPKGIIKKKFVNGYEIPNIFNIDEEQYSKLITEVYTLIKNLRQCFIKKNKKVWSNVSITIENFQFKAEFGYEDLKKFPYGSYERHVIWRFKHLDEDIEALSRKDRKIIESYANFIQVNKIPKRDMYIEGIYKLPVKNIIDFEKTLSVEEAMARTEKDSPKEKTKGFSLIKKKKIEEEQKGSQDDSDFNNQILNWKK